MLKIELAHHSYKVNHDGLEVLKGQTRGDKVTTFKIKSVKWGQMTSHLRKDVFKTLFVINEKLDETKANKSRNLKSSNRAIYSSAKAEAESR